MGIGSLQFSKQEEGLRGNVFCDLDFGLHLAWSETGSSRAYEANKLCDVRACHGDPPLNGLQIHP